MRRKIILVLITYFSFHSYVCHAAEKINVTDEMISKIAYPYNQALANDTWDLIEYRENTDGSIEYTIQFNDEITSAIKQTIENDKYVLDITENGLKNRITIDIDAEKKQILDEQQLLSEFIEKETAAPETKFKHL